MFKPKTRQDKMCALLKKLYHNVNGTHLSLDERKRLQLEETSYTYGEIITDSFARLLQLAAPQEHDVFYDLGSGIGKAVFAAALLYDWKKCCGIEFLPALHETAVTLLEKFSQLPELEKYFPQTKFNIQFFHQDFFQTDLSDANVIFVNSTAFHTLLWEKLATKLEETQSGTRIITTSKRLADTHFEQIAEGMLSQSWGVSSALVYQRK